MPNGVPVKAKNLLPLGSALLAGVSLLGCSDTEEPNRCEAAGEGAGYVIATSIFNDAGASTYVSLLDSLDVGSVPLDQAQEHAGFATIATFDGKLFVGDGEAPEIRRYQVGEGCGLDAAGKLSFAHYGAVTAPLYRNVFVDTDVAWMAHEEVRRIAWDPSTMEIEGVLDVEGLEAKKGGLDVKSAWDRGVAVRDGYTFQPFYWTDGVYYRFDQGSSIAVYSNEDGSLVKFIETPCPGLDVASMDEEGNLYFSNWVFTAAAPLLEENAEESCTVRIRSGQLELDEAFTQNLSDKVGGNQTAGFRYLADGVALVAVLDEENLVIDGETQPGDITYGNVWKLWRLNLETGAAAPVEGLGHIAGGYYAFDIEGRTFLLLPTADYAKTTVYELPVAGAAQRRFETPGWAYQFVKL